MPYKFDYAVKDDYYYVDFAHEAYADDKGYVAGSYRVALPDGRTQIVNYKADDYTGYVADVKYEGNAKYPEYKPAYKPDYKPDYKPEYKPEYKPAYKPEYKPEYKPSYPEYKPSYPEYKPAYKPASYPAPKYPAPKY